MPQVFGRHPARAGYTVIEVMIAMAVLAIGTTGIIAMQKVTAVANRDAKNLVIANQIARTWMERLRTDAVKWNHPSPGSTTSDLPETTWLKNADGAWFMPAADGTMTAMANALGEDVANANQAVFCTNVRISWLYGPPPGTPPPYLLRAEVRVYWLRDGGGGVVEPGKSICDASIPLANVGSALANYHFVYLTSGITENMGL
jgi:type IV pilus assembly protein PilV